MTINDHQHSLSIQQLPIVPFDNARSCDKLCLWQVPTAGDALMLRWTEPHAHSRRPVREY